MSITFTDMTNGFAPSVKYNGINPFVVAPSLISTNDPFGALSILANNTPSKTKTLAEVYKEAADMPVQSIPLVYVNDTPQYSQLKNDDDIKKSVIKYYYYKLLEKYVFNDMTGILAFVKITDNKPSLIKSSDDFDIKKTSNESKQNLELRADFIKNTFFTKDFVKKILKKIIKTNRISWYDLYDNEGTVKKALYSAIIKHLKKRLTE